MTGSDFDDTDLSALNRQQRITNIMQSILPQIDAQRQKQKLAQGALVTVAMMLFFTSGYTIGQTMRPLSYSEKVIVQKLIDHTAREQKKSREEITENLVRHLHVEKVKDIKSHQLNAALNILGQYID